ncbi:MAG: hypothetical protein CSB47_04585 [Proteobacteria bacterium]|nr:MAG: hypothetical protein CSB47_04585 [Pseudomonadota bacterium]
MMLSLRLLVLVSLLLAMVPSWASDNKPALASSDVGMLQPVGLDEMNEWVRDAMKKRITVRSYKPIPSGTVPRPITKRMATPVRSNAPAVSVYGQEGVGADLVKTDGRYIYALNRQTLGKARQSVRILDTQYQGDKLRQVSYVGFGNEIDLQGMYFVKQRQLLVLLGSAYANKNQGNATHLIFIDVANKYKPRVLQRIRLDGLQNTSRRVGDVLYLALSNWLQLPQTYYSVARDKPLSDEDRAAHSRRLEVGIDRWNIKHKLPRYTAVGNQQPLPLITDKQFYMDRGNPEQIYNMTVLLAIDLTAPDFKFNSKAYFGYMGTFYDSGKAFYLTSHYYDGLLLKKLPVDGSVVHKFAYQGMNIEYRGSAVVPGQFDHNSLSNFQLSENQKGHLRVVTYNGYSLENDGQSVLKHAPVILTVLKEHPAVKKLSTLSQLPNLQNPKPFGETGDRRYGVKLFGDYAYFVSSRKTDPVRMIDLRNSWNIRVTGEWPFPEFSDYLYPLGKGLLLGIEESAMAKGKGTKTGGLKLSLLDISNPWKPRKRDVVTIGKTGTFSPASPDYRSVSLLPMANAVTRMVLPIAVTQQPQGETITGLHRFEIHHRTKKILSLGAMIPPDNGWFGAWGDRSLIIGDKVYYYHNNQFWVQRWDARGNTPLTGR